MCRRRNNRESLALLMCGRRDDGDPSALLMCRRRNDRKSLALLICGRQDNGDPTALSGRLRIVRSVVCQHWYLHGDERSQCVDPGAPDQACPGHRLVLNACCVTEQLHFRDTGRD